MYTWGGPLGLEGVTCDLLTIAQVVFSSAGRQAAKVNRLWSWMSHYYEDLRELPEVSTGPGRSLEFLGNTMPGPDNHHLQGLATPVCRLDLNMVESTAPAAGSAPVARG